MRLLNSTAISVSTVAGSSPRAALLRLEIEGSESSSATNGSSMVGVAGKKRLPAVPWANADSPTPPQAMVATSSASARAALLKPFFCVMSLLRNGLERQAAVARRDPQVASGQALDS